MAGGMNGPACIRLEIGVDFLSHCEGFKASEAVVHDLGNYIKGQDHAEENVSCLLKIGIYLFKV